MKRRQNMPKLGKQWIHIGMIRVQDQKLIEKKMAQFKIPIKIAINHMHPEEDPRHKQFKEIYVGRGFRREAMKVMKVLFAAPSKDA